MDANVHLTSVSCWKTEEEEEEEHSFWEQPSCGVCVCVCVCVVRHASWWESSEEVTTALPGTC